MQHPDTEKPERDLSLPEDGSIPDFLKRKPGNVSPWGNNDAPLVETVPMRNPVFAPADDAAPAADAPADDAPKGKAKAAGNGKAPKAAAKAPAKAAGAAKAAKGAKAPAKAADKAPKAERQRDPAKLDQFGFRKGSTKSEAAALYAKGNGATLAQVKEAVGSVQFNLLTELKEKGFKIETDEVKNEGGRMVTRYKLHPKD